MPRLPFNPYRKQLTFMAVVTCLVLLGLVMIVSPDFVKDVGWRSSYLPFFVLMLLGLFWTTWALTGRWKRSGLWSIVFISGMWLRTYQLDSVLNYILLFCFGAVWEYYWHISKES